MRPNKKETQKQHFVKYSLQTKHTLIQFIKQKQIAEKKWNVVAVKRSERVTEKVDSAYNFVRSFLSNKKHLLPYFALHCV